MNIESDLFMFFIIIYPKVLADRFCNMQFNFLYYDLLVKFTSKLLLAQTLIMTIIFGFDRKDSIYETYNSRTVFRLEKISWC